MKKMMIAALVAVAMSVGVYAEEAAPKAEAKCDAKKVEACKPEAWKCCSGDKACTKEKPCAKCAEACKKAADEAAKKAADEAAKKADQE